MVTQYHRPKSREEALGLLSAIPGALPLAGGTQLLSSECAERAFAAVSLGTALDARVDPGSGPEGNRLAIGAMATFQDLIDSRLMPGPLEAALRGMIDRNIRNRATIGGNIGADKSCSSLIPLLLAVEASLELATGRTLPLEGWLELEPGMEGRQVVARVRLRTSRETLAGYARWSRSACDLSVLGVGVAYRVEAGGRLRGLRLVLGGMDPHARRFPALESLFEGRPLPDRDAIEGLVAPALSPISDARGSAEFKRLRMSALVAEALLGAAPFVIPGEPA